MKKVLAADIGFRSTGMAIFCFTQEGWKLFDKKCLHTEQAHSEIVESKRAKKGFVKKQLCSVAIDDIRRTESMATGIINYFIENQCGAMACEIPNGGAQSASAQKCMGAATAMISVVRLVLQCPAEWITPNESRAAAGWIKTEHPEADGAEIKKFVMATMEAKYPTISELKLKNKEHIADACATFEAARGRQVIKDLEK